LALSVHAQDDPLAALRATLTSLREHPDEHLESRGATPQLTVAKHQLREWIEASLTGFGESGDEAALARELNSALSGERFLCDYSVPGADERCPDERLLGSLKDIRIRRELQFLVVETSVGIRCGYDASAYIYEWTGERWQRRWESEQDDYAEKHYFPQMLDAVRISGSIEDHRYMVLTLGQEPWCSSNWHNVYYRLWRFGSDAQTPKLLLEESDWAYLGAHDPPIQGSLGRDDVLIEFTLGSIDPTVHSYEVVRHYSVRDDTVQRVDPIALRPRDFVEEWLGYSWAQGVPWAEPTSQAALKVWEQRIHTSSVEFMESSFHCPKTPDLWQVGINLTIANQEPKERKETPAYFLVRWRPPYRFSMVNIGNRPFPGCTEKDPEADAPRTLFPAQ
jgi:hypothetical protein